LCRIRNRIYHQILESSEQLSEPPSDVVPAEPWSSSAQQADAERRATLSQLLDTHKGNLDHLHKQQASHGLTPPLAVLNQLAHEEREIKRIEAELRLLDAAPEH